MSKAIPPDISSTLSALPAWDSMTAYQRALNACRELTKRGQKIPAWTALRVMIGKGSPADLKRAVDDFRIEQAEAMVGSDLGLAQIPLETTKLFREVWALAVQQASGKFDTERAKLLDRVEIANHAAQEADAKFRIEEIARKNAENSLKQKSEELDALSLTLAQAINQQDHLLLRLQQQESELSESRTSSSACIMQLEIKAMELIKATEKIHSLQKQLERSEKRLDLLIGSKN